VVKRSWPKVLVVCALSGCAAAHDRDTEAMKARSHALLEAYDRMDSTALAGAVAPDFELFEVRAASSAPRR
jgi:hypothetical protein